MTATKPTYSHASDSVQPISCGVESSSASLGASKATSLAWLGTAGRGDGTNKRCRSTTVGGFELVDDFVGRKKFE